MKLKQNVSLMGELLVLLLVCSVHLGCSGSSTEKLHTDGDPESSLDGDMDVADGDSDEEYETDSEAEAETPSHTCAEHPFDSEARLDDDTIVFLGQVDGYPVFRIPAVVTTPTGTILAFAEARPSIEDPGSGEIDLVMKRSTDCGQTWSDLVVLAENGSGDAHNPAALVAPDSDGDSVVWLFFNKRPASEGGEFDLPPGLGDDSASIWLMTSADEGESWSEPREITEQAKDPEWAIASTGPGIGIVTRWGTDDAPAGRMIVPGWYTFGSGTEGEGSFVMLSDDFGETWRLGGLPEPITNESQVVELTDGRILFNGRQNAATGSPTRFHFFSDDGGESWSEPEEGLEMTRVMASIVRHSAERDGDERDILLHSGVDVDGRTDVRVWLSFNEGESWERETIIHKGFTQYSVLTLLPDKTIGLVYEALELVKPGIPLSIRFARFNLELFNEGSQ